MPKKGQKTKQNQTVAKKSSRQQADKAFHIVCIGASAGGLGALEKFFTRMPPDSGMAFVVVTHLDPTHESLLTELLTKYTRMKCPKVEEDMVIEPNCVYVIPPNRTLKIQDGSLHLNKPVEPRGMRHPIDLFLRSLALDQAEHAVCVILSGTGTDGTIGLRVVKEEGGLVVVQEEVSAQYPGMPGSAIRTGLVDLILSVEEIPAKLVEFSKHSVALNRSAKPLASQQGICDLLPKIFKELRNRTGQDFSAYKKNTVIRRIERRMAFQGIDQGSDYCHHLHESPAEAEALFRDLLIGVTSFFRDPKAFDALSRQVLTGLVESKQANEPIRVWVAGCGTGEEAYSIAILLQEHLAASNQNHPVQIFATDLDRTSIDTARAGIYPDSISADVSTERLRQFFKKLDNSYQVSSQIRETVIFAPHNLIQDPPFFKLDLICCRNLLIYIKAELQKKVLPLFCYALQPDGFLFLGASETIGVAEDLFIPVEQKWKIFQRRSIISPNRAHFPLNFPSGTTAERNQTGGPPAKRVNVGGIADRTLLDKYSPPCVVVNEKYEVVHFSTRTSKYLEPPVGEPNLNILRMAREELRAPLRVIVHKAFSEKKRTVSRGLKIRDGDVEQVLNLIVEPLKEPPFVSGLAMVVLEEVGTHLVQEPSLAKAAGETAEESQDLLVRQLEDELRRTSEQLRVTIEESESANEELKASNEELMSMNEELQSTNEELETSKEELSALNEELMSVNSEYQNKLLEVEEANSDLLNLVNSTQIATLFLDNQLRVRNFTPATSEIFHLIQSDIGRPLHHLTSKVETQNLTEDAQKVMETLEGVEREIAGHGHQWYIMRIHPYRTVKDVIDGVVLTFVDITDRKQVEEIRRVSEARMEVLVKLSQMTQAPFEQASRFVMESALAITSSKFSMIALLNSEAATLSEIVAEGGNERFTTAAWPDQGQKLCAEIIRHPQPMIINDIDAPHSFQGCFPQGDKPIKRLLVVPVMDQEQVRAIALVGNKEEAYEDSDLRQLQLLMDGLWILVVREQARAAMEQARTAADDASLAKSEFLANTSHEIRTPLTGILGWIELALTTDLLPDQRQYLEMAQESSGLLKTILEDVLDFSKIEARNFELNMVPFPLRSSVLTAVNLLNRSGAEKGLTVSMDISTQVPEVVIGDEVRLSQVLINLLSNAIKFTQQGAIEVRVTEEEKDPDSPERATVRFSVCDSGIGIPADKMARLFKSFSQIDSSSTRNYGGTGLGLAVSKGLVEAMGGSIQAQSKEGKGSEFSFTIPFEVHKATLPTEQNSSGLNPQEEKIGPIRILLAEDDPSNAHLIKLMLNQKSCDVVIATNGQETVEIWETDAFDLILMDVQMSEMNGLDATRAIRKREKSTDAHIPILALTAHAGKEDIAQCMDAGMDGYLSKPINIESLYSAISQNIRTGSCSEKIDTST